MCGRYVFIPDKNFNNHIKLAKGVELRPNYNVAPGQTMPVVVTQETDNVQLMRWGLIPFWAKDPSFGFKTINARSEDVSQKPSFRGPLKNRRCLIPASGFYEWSRHGRTKTPYYFQLKHQPYFYFAGLYDIFKDTSGSEIYSYTILTTKANDLVGQIHDRMPVILSQAAARTWSDNSSYQPQILQPLTSPYPAVEMTAHQVSNLVNSTANNSPDLLKATNQN